MRWYILHHLYEQVEKDVGEKIENERFVFYLLRKNGIITNSFDLKLVEEVIDKALMEEDIRERSAKGHGTVSGLAKKNRRPAF